MNTTGIVQFLNLLTFDAVGTSNEPLSVASINGTLVPQLTNNGKDFKLSMAAPAEGHFEMNLALTDLAGNTANFSRSVDIVLKVLNGDLISIVPLENGKLRIVGIPYSSRPGVLIAIDGGFFNRQEIYSNSNGSFEADLNFFTHVTLVATDDAISRTDRVDMDYNVDTTLSGVILDNQKRPLSSVKVSIASSNQFALTDGTGAFRIENPATGDQTLVIDGTTIPVEVSGPNRKFSKVAVSVSLGTRQTNVLDDPIHLTPMMFDGTETAIPDENTSVTVTSPHAEGVTLSIPAGVATFPNGEKIGSINMMEIPSDVASLPLLEFSKPNNVIALEPSGTKFSERVELRLPNVNEIPAGIQLAIISKNSEKGIWEIDGFARVSEDGSEVVTEPGQGISHFSEVYASPLGPYVRTIGSQDQAGTDTFNGAMTTSLSLPSYKALGQSIAPSLVYRSTWANPTAVVSNLIDVPRNEYHFSGGASGGNLLGKVSVDVSGVSWIEPDFITAQFFTNDLISDKMTFTGVPNKSVISFGIDLGSQESGVYPYSSKYEIHLKQMIFGTRTTRTKKLFGKTRVSQEPFGETRAIEEVFPSDLGGPLIVQNKINSEAGRGWKIGNAGRIYSIDQPKILLESEEGSIQTYSVNDTIDTIFYDSNKNITNADLSLYPNLYFYSDNQRLMYELNATTGEITNTLGSVPNYTGRFEAYSVGYQNCSLTYESTFDENGIPTGVQSYSHNTYICSLEHTNFNINREVRSILKIDDDILGSSFKGNIFSMNGGLQHKSGEFYEPSSTISWSFGAPWAFDWYCPNYLYSSCGAIDNISNRGTVVDKVPTQLIGQCGQGRTGVPDQIRQICEANGRVAHSTGKVPSRSFKDGENPAYNGIMGIIRGLDGKILIADSGNNRVRSLDYSSNISTTIAGNGQTYDNGNDGLAVDASLYHPRGLLLDTQGNLYVTTERGYIRKIDPTGRISHFAGKRPEDGGVLATSAQAEEMYFEAPFGMAIDEDNGYLYVADTGHHRVVQINLVTKEAVTIAGNGSCSGTIGDGLPALESSLCSPEFIGLDHDKNLLIADKGHNRIRRVTFSNSTDGSTQYASTAKDSSKIIKNADGSFTRSLRDGSIVFYNSQGLQERATSRNGRELSYFYDSSNRLTSTQDPVGLETRYIYSGNKLTSIVDPADRVTQFVYNGDLLEQVIFPDGTSKSYEYDSKGLMTAESNQRNIRTEYQYNVWNRLEKVIRPDSTSIIVNDFKSSTIGNNFTGGNVGQLKSLNQTESYDGIKDAKGSETKFNSDETGFVTSITDANNQVTRIERDLDGRPLKITRPDNTFTTFEYDQTYFDLVKKYDSFSGITEEYNYNQEGSLLTQSDNRGTLVSNTYDPTTGNLLSSTNILNQVSSSTYNNLSLVSSQTNSLGQTIQWEFDSQGNAIKVIAPDLSEAVLERDLAGNVIKRINAKGQITLNEFDIMNRLISVTNPKGDKTRYEYLPTGELSKIIYPNLAEVIFEYNSMGRLTKKIDAIGMITQLNYDSNGNIVQEIDPSGNIKVFEYNNLDQLVKKLLPDDVYEYSYNVRGELIQAKNLVSQVDLEYLLTHKGSQVSSVFTQGLGVHSDLPAVELNYSFDSYGNKILTETPFGDFSYQYDIANRLKILTNALNEEYSFNFDNGNRLTEITRPGSTSNFALDDTNFLTSIIHKNSNTSGEIAKFIYQKDPIGIRTQMRTLAGDHDYSYDSNNQLTSASHPEIASESFSYDDLGNRTQDQNQSYFYDARKQRLVEDALYLYWYDSRGNLASKQAKDNSSVVNYIHNTQNQLIQIDFFEGTNKIKETRYLYDALGRRVKKQVTDLASPSKSFTRHYTFDGNELLAGLDQNNQLLALYTQSTMRTDDTLAVHITSVGATQGLALASGNYQFIKDGLGSVTEVTNSSGSVVQHYVYGSFGNLLAIYDGSGTEVTDAPPIANPYGYTGRELDFENYSVSERCGLMYYRSRYYDTCTGRFINEDLVGFAGKSMNLYSYVKNNVINRKDASGKGGIGIGVGAGIGLCLGLIIRNKVDEIREKEMKEINFQRNLLLNQLDSQLASYIKSREIDSTSARILFDEFQRLKARLNEANSLNEINNLREDAYEAIKIIEQYRFNNGLP